LNARSAGPAFLDMSTHQYVRKKSLQGLLFILLTLNL
jgi:hypothetical protein